MRPKPDALVMNALPGRVRFRIPGKKGNASYFEELLSAISKCSGLERLVINPATASILIHYDAENTSELNGFLERNEFFQVVEQSPQSSTDDKEGGKVTREVRQKNEDKVETALDLTQIAGMGLIGWSGLRLLQGGFTAPPWHAALWYGFVLLRDRHAAKQILSSSAAQA